MSSPKGSTLKIWRRCIEAKRLLHGDINKKFGDGNIKVNTNCPIFRSLAKNDFYYESFVNRGLIRTARRGDYEAIAADIYYRLLSFFSLESSLQSKLESLSRGWEDRFVVGMQVRVGLGNSAFLDNCKFLYMQDVETFVHYAELFSNRSRRTPLWFISTDSPQVEAMLRRRFPAFVESIQELPMKHTKALAYQYKDPATQRAILDNYLLSKSDLLLTTAWSSFGEMALGRMQQGRTIMITRSDPIRNPPPVVYFNRSSVYSSVCCSKERGWSDWGNDSDFFRVHTVFERSCDREWLSVQFEQTHSFLPCTTVLD